MLSQKDLFLNIINKRLRNFPYSLLEESKKWRLELYNALRGSSYTINSNRNQSLQKKCKPLYDYVRYASRIKENKKGGMTANSAIEEAVNWAIKENLLEGFFKRQKEEVLAMSLTEFDAEEVIRDILDEGKELGANQKAIESAENLLKMNVLTVEQIAQAVSLPLEKIIELQKESVPGQSST